MGTVYAFFADGFEEIEAFTAIDTLRRGGLNVEIVSVTPDEIVDRKSTRLNSSHNA